MADPFDLESLDVRHVGRLRVLHLEPGVLAWWGPMEDGFPFDEPESQRFAVVTGGEIAGLVQWGDDSWNENRHAYIDVFLGENFSGRGLGTEVVRRVVAMLVDDHGYHRITIDAAPGNKAAVRCYEKAGFRVVGELERAYLEPRSQQWTNELLLEFVVKP